MSNAEQIIHLSRKNIFFNIHELGSVKKRVLAVEKEKLQM